MGRTLAVVGGGVIGSMIAWQAARKGWDTTIYERDPTESTSWVAGGMLGCMGEARPGEDTALDLARASARRWPDLLTALADPTIVVATDTVLVAADTADAHELATRADYLLSRGLAMKPLRGRDIRSVSPGLGSSVRGGYLAPGEGAVDNRALLRALRTAATQVGVTTRTRHVTDLDDLDADQVVVAAGVGAGRLWPPAAIRAEKGEILRLRRPPTAPPPPDNVIRARWRGRLVYLVPRADGVVVGATQYEVGVETDPEPRAGGVADLLTDAIEVMPGLAEYRVSEVGGGMRPVTPDALPLIGRLDERTVLAAGHGRNGIMLAPITAELVVDHLDDTVDPRWSATLDPRRFT